MWVTILASPETCGSLARRVLAWTPDKPKAESFAQYGQENRPPVRVPPRTKATGREPVPGWDPAGWTPYGPLERTYSPFTCQNPPSATRGLDLRPGLPPQQPLYPPTQPFRPPTQQRYSTPTQRPQDMQSTARGLDLMPSPQSFRPPTQHRSGAAAKHQGYESICYITIKISTYFRL